MGASNRLVLSFKYFSLFPVQSDPACHINNATVEFHHPISFAALLATSIEMVPSVIGGRCSSLPRNFSQSPALRRIITDVGNTGQG